MEFEFFGRPAHAAANPHEGVNALDALIVMFNAIGLLRQQIRTDARIHGVISYGGGAPNVIPPYTSCRFRIRGTEPEYTEELVQRVIACAQAGATATGCRVEWKEYIRPYLNMVPNQTLGATFRENLGDWPRRAGRAVARRLRLDRLRQRQPQGAVGLRLPRHLRGPEAGWHSKEVAAATKTPRGHAAIVAGAKSLAMTAIDILADDTLREQAKQEHRRAMGSDE